MNDSARRTDRELFEAVTAGEAQALAELAGRHARGLFDFALRGTLDEQQSADVVDAAFRRVREPGAQIPNQIDFRTWLYSLGLIDVLAVSNEARTARISTDDERFFHRTTDIDLDVAHWAWQAARGLRTRDYCVLDLTLRRGLTPEEVAEAASLTRSNLYGSIGRARGAFEETFAAMVLFERGRDACPELDEMVDSAPGTGLRPALRHQIIEHAEDCDACRRTLDSLPPAAGIFVSLADIEMPESLVRRILDGAAGSFVLSPTSLVGAALPSAAAIAPAAASGATALRALPGDEEGDDDDEALDGPDGSDNEEPEDQDRDAIGRAAGAAAPVGGRPLAAPATQVRNEPEEPLGREPVGSRLAAAVEGARGQPIQWTYVLLGVLAVLAIYLGVAVADSLQSGGSDSGAVPLDSAAVGTTGPMIECGDAPLEMNEGISTIITFDEAALDGYQISALSHVPLSSQATFEGIETTVENPFLIGLSAIHREAAEARTDEYELRIQWQRDGETASSLCRLLVHVAS